MSHNFDTLTENMQHCFREYPKMKARIAELEKQLADIHASTRRMSFQQEWYLAGLRHSPGDYVLMRVGPVTADDMPF